MAKRKEFEHCDFIVEPNNSEIKSNGFEERMLHGTQLFRDKDAAEGYGSFHGGALISIWNSYHDEPILLEVYRI